MFFNADGSICVLILGKHYHQQRPATSTYAVLKIWRYTNIQDPWNSLVEVASEDTYESVQFSATSTLEAGYYVVGMGVEQIGNGNRLDDFLNGDNEWQAGVTLQPVPEPSVTAIMMGGCVLALALARTQWMRHRSLC